MLCDMLIVSFLTNETDHPYDSIAHLQYMFNNAMFISIFFDHFPITSILFDVNIYCRFFFIQVSTFGHQ